MSVVGWVIMEFVRVVEGVVDIDVIIKRFIFLLNEF